MKMFIFLTTDFIFRWKFLYIKAKQNGLFCSTDPFPDRCRGQAWSATSGG